MLSDIPTFRELWDAAALFVPPNDAERFALAINRLAEDSMLRHRFGALARQRAGAFTLDRQVANVQRVYAKALTTHAPTLATAG